MNELAVFAGAGGGILGGHLLGWRTVCAVERDPYAASVLLARQNDGILPAFPIWDDVCTFDGRPWQGLVDVISGGFPCQDISSAGKGAGIDGERSGLWREMARIIGEVRPRFAFVENSPVLTSRGLDRVLGDLAEMGFDAKWGVVSAEDVGAPHRRERIWIVANASGRRFGEPQERQMEQPRRAQAISASVVADANLRDGGSLAIDSREFAARNEKINARQRFPLIAGDCGASEMADAKKQRARGLPIGTSSEYTRFGFGSVDAADECGGWWESEPNVGRVAHGVAARVDRLKAIGNEQVPLVAGTAWRFLS